MPIIPAMPPAACLTSCMSCCPSVTSSHLCHRQYCIYQYRSFHLLPHGFIQQKSFQHESGGGEDRNLKLKKNKNIFFLRMWLRVAVMAADGSDELLHAVLGAAVAGGTRLMHQRGVHLARPHAHAGVSPAAFYSACLYHDDQTTVIQMRLWVCFMLFISACILQTHVVGEGLVHAKIHATCPVGMILVPHIKFRRHCCPLFMAVSMSWCGGFAHLQQLVLGTSADTSCLPVISARDGSSKSVSTSCTYLSIRAFIVNDQEHAVSTDCPCWLPALREATGHSANIAQSMPIFDTCKHGQHQRCSQRTAACFVREVVVCRL